VGGKNGKSWWAVQFGSDTVSMQSKDLQLHRDDPCFKLGKPHAGRAKKTKKNETDAPTAEI
jgi:hypothetical protein